jgi:hypothetical protein
MQKLAFTVCSNNFLSYALSFANSFRENNPDYTTVIGLADKKSPAIDYSRFAPHIIVAMDEVGISNLSWMTGHYNIVELNTAVKPYFFAYLFRKFDAEHVLFFDPDIFVYDSVLTITRHFGENDIVLTPHVIYPIPRDVYPWENHFLNHGLYNLGFIGLKNSANVQTLLKWWQERTAEHCFANYRKGLYVDQLWANFIPLFFEKVCIVKDAALNVAFWNLHERSLSYTDDKHLVNDRPLIFFHFSAFNPRSPELLTKENHTNFDHRTNPGLIHLLQDYQQILLKNNYDFFSRQPFAYSKEEQINSELQALTHRIGRAEMILGFLRLRLINKERLVDYFYQLFKDYMNYNNLHLKDINDDRYNSIEYANHMRENIHLNLVKKVKVGFFTRLRMLRYSFKVFWK